jgi:ABC-2 type transport system permease protein
LPTPPVIVSREPAPSLAQVAARPVGRAGARNAAAKFRHHRAGHNKTGRRRTAPHECHNNTNWVRTRSNPGRSSAPERGGAVPRPFEAFARRFVPATPADGAIAVVPSVLRCDPKLTSFLTFTLAATVVQGVLFGCVQGATDLATDIELGFFERLVAAPASRGAILVARLVGSVVVGIVQGALFTGLLVAFGARIAGGVPAVLVLLLASGLLALAFGGLLAAMALKTGSAEAVQSSFPIVFILLFASSAFFPRQTMRGVFKKFAGINPISHVVEGLRSLIINGWSASAALKAILVPIAMAVVTFALAVRAMQKRLATK